MDTIIEALASADITLPSATSDRLSEYCRLLWEKNKVINLTRHEDFSHFVNRDLVDTLELSKLIGEGEKVLDVGSGGGVPGLVLAILRPDLEITLSDSIGKKTAVLADLCDALALNVEVQNARAEVLLDETRYDVVTARAVGPLAKMLKWFEPCWINMRRLLVIKGPKWQEEKHAAEQERLMRFLLLKVAARYNVPGENWESVILEIKRIG